MQIPAPLANHNEFTCSHHTPFFTAENDSASALVINDGNINGCGLVNKHEAEIAHPSVSITAVAQTVAHLFSACVCAGSLVFAGIRTSTTRNAWLSAAGSNLWKNGNPSAPSSCGDEPAAAAAIFVAPDCARDTIYHESHTAESQYATSTNA